MSFNSQSGGWDAPDRSTAKWFGFPKSFVSPRVIRNQGKQDKSVQTEFRVSRWEAPVDQQKCYVCPRLIAIQSTRIILKQQISDPRYRASPMSPNGRADGVFRFLAGNRAFRPTRCREIFTVAQTLALTGRAANTADYCGRGRLWPWSTVAVDYRIGRRRLQPVVIRTTIDLMSCSVFERHRWKSDLKVRRCFPNRFR